MVEMVCWVPEIFCKYLTIYPENGHVKELEWIVVKGKYDEREFKFEVPLALLKSFKRSDTGCWIQQGLYYCELYGDTVRLLRPAESADMVYIVTDDVIVGKNKYRKDFRVFFDGEKVVKKWFDENFIGALVEKVIGAE